ncbi:MAG: GNAT family N-acetyltransferase [Dichotomicrobium sp.]
MTNVVAEIAPFREADFARLDEIRARAFAPVFRALRQLVGPDVAGVVFADAEAEQGLLLERLCAPESVERVFVARVDDKVVGFVSILLDDAQMVGEIGLNAVDPDYAGCGIGTQLYAFALEEMRAAGMKVAAVSTGADPSHAPARRAYAKAGFSCAVPSQWMYKRL